VSPLALQIAPPARRAALQLRLREPLPAHHDAHALGGVAHVVERVGLEQEQVGARADRDDAPLLGAPMNSAAPEVAARSAS
jgi:hypothetical protein